MDEKIIARSKLYNIEKFKKMCIVLGAILFAIMFIAEFSDTYSKVYRWRDGEVTVIGFFIEEITDSLTSFSSFWWFLGIPAIGFVIPALLGVFIHSWLSKIELIVTDKRVYGTAAFGRRVDLPFDSISAIGTGWPKGIEVSTSSGKISFLAIKNCDEIHNVLSRLLIERQSVEKSVSHTTIKQEIPQSNADELKKYKELLDSGVISQEEFDAKKKQLLGL